MQLRRHGNISNRMHSQGLKLTMTTTGMTGPCTSSIIGKYRFSDEKQY